MQGHGPSNINCCTIVFMVRTFHNQSLNYGRCLLIQRYFCAVYDYAGKQIVARAIGIQKENRG